MFRNIDIENHICHTLNYYLKQKMCVHRTSHAHPQKQYITILGGIKNY